MNRQYTQVGNAVPVALGRAIGSAIVQATESRSKYSPEPVVMLEAAIKRLRRSARNKKSVLAEDMREAVA
jgi:DNA (cytosine-5)-methyltransferase 1